MQMQTAEATSVLLCKLNAALNAQLAGIEQTCEPNEFSRQHRLFGLAMAGLLDIANALYHEHPSLKLTQLGGPCVLPDAVVTQSVDQLIGA